MNRVFRVPGCTGSDFLIGQTKSYDRQGVSVFSTSACSEQFNGNFKRFPSFVFHFLSNLLRKFSPTSSWNVDIVLLYKMFTYFHSALNASILLFQIVGGDDYVHITHNVSINGLSLRANSCLSGRSDNRIHELTARFIVEILKHMW